MMPPADPDALAKSMIEASARRMAQADVDEHRSVTAYRAGRFQDYWERLGREAEARVEAAYAELDANTPAGDGGAGSGSVPAAGDTQDDTDLAPEPPQQGGPAAGGGFSPTASSGVEG